MIEYMLDGSPPFSCFRQSSASVVGPFFMYTFTLITVVMLLNMLIALLNATWEKVANEQRSAFLLQRAMTMDKYLGEMPPAKQMKIQRKYRWTYVLLPSDMPDAQIEGGEDEMKTLEDKVGTFVDGVTSFCREARHWVHHQNGSQAARHR